ncbi:hypothetical protein [Alkalinema sp. FACHB-956]|uniref:hypothetical protein n=1 Tax=Alkalinema sp. FACHB-956 TaxID=2692768 RepID=UPI00168429E8|nr:hypothetical protein [Alkalinema sp. FACHB-956]MBD2325952.1 hypothetical protein [Alkalinema sp. FACHB-956]
MNHFGTVLKVLAASIVITLGIKYLAPNITIAPTPMNALIAVLLPTVVVAGGLAVRSQIAPDRALSSDRSTPSNP